MPGRTLLVVVIALAACGGDGPREGSEGSGAVTMASTAGVSDTGTPTEAGGSTDVAPGSTGGAPDGSTSGADGTTSGPGASEGSTLDSDSFPQTTALTFESSESADTMDPPQCVTLLDAMVRDFKQEHVDFESDDGGEDKGIVLEDLGADNKPVYAGQADNSTTHGQAAFDQWYRDVADVNIPIPRQIQLEDDGTGKFVYDNSAFFPIDDQGWGNEGNSHNYHFTLEMHTVFTYKGGEKFKFRGDDDLFVFINKKLAIDLGGVHGPQEFEVDLDVDAAKLGIAPGNDYQLDFFFAERHTDESNFRIETTIGCLIVPG